MSIEKDLKNMDIISFRRCFVIAFSTLMLISGVCAATRDGVKESKEKIAADATVKDTTAIEKPATVDKNSAALTTKDSDDVEPTVGPITTVAETDGTANSSEAVELVPEKEDSAKKVEPVVVETAAESEVVTESTNAPVAAAEKKTKEKISGKTATAETETVDVVEIVAVQGKGTNFTAKGVPRTDRVVNILTTQTVRPGTLALTVDHRAHDSFIAGEDAFFDYLGLDAGNLKIGIGLRLGLKEYLDFGLYRLSNGTDLFDVYEFDTKVRVTNQDDQYINVSLRIGATWFVQKDAKDASGFFSQLNVDRRLFGKLLLGTGFAFHTDSTNDRKRFEDPDPSAAVLGYAEWRPIRRFSLNGEAAVNIAGFGSKFPIFAFSARFLTHRHSFALVVANSQYMSADGIVTNSWRAFDELVFGFQIVREFNLKN